MTNDEFHAFARHREAIAPLRGLRHSSFVLRHSLRRCWLLLIVAGTFALSGASCPQMLQRAAPLPRVLPPSPTLEQVIEVANRNSSQIRSFSTNRASLSGSGFPSLGASVAFERQRRFRLRAGTGMLGAELDVGSNDELFWFWVRREQPPAVYFCRHDQWAACPARRTVPFDPDWLIEALGITEFDPALPHQGPQYLPNDKLRIDTIRNTPEGPVTKITILDGSQGWILEQYVFDARRQLVASSVAGGHRRDPLSGLVLPTTVQIKCPAAQLDMRIDLGNVEINRLSGDATALWSMPSYPNAAVVNLAEAAAPPPAMQSPPTASAQRTLSQNPWRRPGQ